MKKEEQKTKKKKEILEDVIVQNVPSDKAKRWIKQPINMTLLRGDVSRHALYSIVNTIEALQSRIDEYLSRPKQERLIQPSLFADDEVLPVIRIPLKEMGITPQHYDKFEKAIPLFSQNVYEVPEVRNGIPGTSYAPLFSNIWIPHHGPDGKGKSASYVEVTINPSISKYIFYMTRYHRYLKDVVMQCSGRYTARIYMLINANKFTPDKCWTVGYVELRRMLGVDVVEDPNKKPPTWVTAKYPRYQNFKQRVLQDSKNEIDAQAAEGKVDCTFTFTEIYPPGQRRGDPKSIRFNISITELGRRDAREQQESRLAYGVGELLSEYFGFSSVEVLRMTRRMVDIDADLLVAEVKRIKEYIGSHPDIQNRKAYATAVLQEFINQHIQDAEVVTDSQQTGSQENPIPENTLENENLRLGWQAFCAAIRDRVGDERFTCWFAPLQPVSLEDCKLTVSAPSTFVIEYIEENFLEEMSACLKNSFSPDILLSYTVRN